MFGFQLLVHFCPYHRYIGLLEPFGSELERKRTKNWSWNEDLSRQQVISLAGRQLLIGRRVLRRATEIGFKFLAFQALYKEEDLNPKRHLTFYLQSPLTLAVTATISISSPSQNTNPITHLHLSSHHQIPPWT